MFEVVTLATTHLCTACIILMGAGSYVSAPGQSPAFCFKNGPFTYAMWLDYAKKGQKLPVVPPNGISREDRDGKIIFTVGRDIRQCEAP